MYILFSVVTSLKYCRYDVKLYPNNQSINHPMLFDQAKKFGIRQNEVYKFIYHGLPPPSSPQPKMNSMHIFKYYSKHLIYVYLINTQ